MTAAGSGFGRVRTGTDEETKYQSGQSGSEITEAEGRDQASPTRRAVTAANESNTTGDVGTTASSIFNIDVLLHPLVLNVMVANYCAFLANTITGTAFATLNVTESVRGWLFASFMAVQILFTPCSLFLVKLSPDIVGQRVIVGVGQVVLCVGALVIMGGLWPLRVAGAMSTNNTASSTEHREGKEHLPALAWQRSPSTWSLSLLFAGRIISGLGASLTTAHGMAALKDAFSSPAKKTSTAQDKTELNAAFVYASWGIIFGGGSAPLIGGWLVGLSLVAPFAALAGLSLLPVVGLALTTAPSPSSEEADTSSSGESIVPVRQLELEQEPFEVNPNHHIRQGSASSSSVDRSSAAGTSTTGGQAQASFLATTSRTPRLLQQQEHVPALELLANRRVLTLLFAVFFSNAGQALVYMEFATFAVSSFSLSPASAAALLLFHTVPYLLVSVFFARSVWESLGTFPTMAVGFGLCGLAPTIVLSCVQLLFHDAADSSSKFASTATFSLDLMVVALVNTGVGEGILDATYSVGFSSEADKQFNVTPPASEEDAECEEEPADQRGEKREECASGVHGDGQVVHVKNSVYARKNVGAVFVLFRLTMLLGFCAGSGGGGYLVEVLGSFQGVWLLFAVLNVMFLTVVLVQT